jgi:hypothetical protein
MLIAVLSWQLHSAACKLSFGPAQVQWRLLVHTSSN